MANVFIDFRDTAAFVTDPANSTYSIGAIYPETRAGFTFGWTVGTGGAGSALSTHADLSASDAHLAGICYRDNTLSACTFAIDLPDGAGTYKIGLAMGAATAPEPEQHAIFKDGATTLFTVSNSVGPGTNEFVDATGVVRTEATWLSGQAYQTVTMAGTQLTVTIGGGSAGSGFSCLACLYVEFVPPASATPMLLHRFQSAGRVRRR